MKTTRDFLITKLYKERQVIGICEPTYICRCCGKEVIVTKEDVEINHWKTETVTKYECTCDAWNEILKAKKELDEINKEFRQQHSSYLKKYDKVLDKVKNKYDLNLNEHVWRYNTTSYKKGQ